MALDAEQAREMVLEIINQIDYDIYKEVLSAEEEQPEEYNLLDECLEIVEQYIKINP